MNSIFKNIISHLKSFEIGSKKSQIINSRQKNLLNYFQENFRNTFKYTSWLSEKK